MRPVVGIGGRNALADGAGAGGRMRPGAGNSGWRRALGSRVAAERGPRARVRRGLLAEVCAGVVWGVGVRGGVGAQRASGCWNLVGGVRWCCGLRRSGASGLGFGGGLLSWVWADVVWCGERTRAGLRTWLSELRWRRAVVLRVAAGGGAGVSGLGFGGCLAWVGGGCGLVEGIWLSELWLAGRGGVAGPSPTGGSAWASPGRFGWRGAVVLRGLSGSGLAVVGAGGRRCLFGVVWSWAGGGCGLAGCNGGCRWLCWQGPGRAWLVVGFGCGVLGGRRMSGCRNSVRRGCGGVAGCGGRRGPGFPGSGSVGVVVGLGGCGLVWGADAGRGAGLVVGTPLAGCGGVAGRGGASAPGPGLSRVGVCVVWVRVWEWCGGGRGWVDAHGCRKLWLAGRGGVAGIPGSGSAVVGAGGRRRLFGVVWSWAGGGCGLAGLQTGDVSGRGRVGMPGRVRG